MKFKLLKTILLLQLLIWCCDSALYAQNDSINSDSINIISNQNCESDSSHNGALDISEQSNTNKGAENNIYGIPSNIILALCLLSTLFSFIALCISLKSRGNNNQDYYEDDEFTSHNNYQKRVEACEKNVPNIFDLKDRVFRLEKQMKRLEDSNINNNDSIDSEQSNQTQLTTKGKEKSGTRVWLKVIDGGRLALVESPESAYYRAWTNSSNGITYFEFDCLRPGKAINNRTSLIEPFCEIQKGDIEPDLAKGIIIIKQGILNNDYSIISKVVIQYN